MIVISFDTIAKLIHCLYLIWLFSITENNNNSHMFLYVKTAHKKKADWKLQLIKKKKKKKNNVFNQYRNYISIVTHNFILCMPCIFDLLFLTHFIL